MVVMSGVHAVMAVKRLALAKSRLAPALDPARRARLVLAMFDDTLRAALAADLAVTVVTPDVGVADLARSLGAAVLAEPPAASADGLNSALAAGFAAVQARHGAVDVLALQADLPALRPTELSDALAAADSSGRWLITDHQGLGTTALLYRGTPPTRPCFGRESARRHRAAGAREPAGHWPGLRHDVDTPQDLCTVVELGVGSATAAELDALSVPFRAASACGDEG
jgi:2-phospho-L-lactate guanylyltransferase